MEPSRAQEQIVGTSRSQLYYKFGVVLHEGFSCMPWSLQIQLLRFWVGSWIIVSRVLLVQDDWFLDSCLKIAVGSIVTPWSYTNSIISFLRCLLNSLMAQDDGLLDSCLKNLNSPRGPQILRVSKICLFPRKRKSPQSLQDWTCSQHFTSNTIRKMLEHF